MTKTVICLGIIISLITVFIVLSCALSNFPSSPLSDLTWSARPYNIYYLDKSAKSLHSILTDGSQEKILLESDVNIKDYLVVKDGSLLLLTDSTAHLINADGVLVRRLWESPDQKILHWYLSEDSKHLVLQTESLNATSPPDNLYLIALSPYSASDSNRPLMLPNDLHSITNLRWLIDSQHIVFSYISKPAANEKFMKLDTLDSKSTILGTQSYLAPESSKRTLDSYLDPTLLVVPNPEYRLRHTFDMTADRKNTVSIVRGSVFVSHKEVLHWRNYDEHNNQGCSRPIWLPDDRHVIASCNQMLILIEPDTSKAAKLVDGSNPRWLGQLIDNPQ